MEGGEGKERDSLEPLLERASVGCLGKGKMRACCAWFQVWAGHEEMGF